LGPVRYGDRAGTRNRAIVADGYDGGILGL